MRYRKGKQGSLFGVYKIVYNSEKSVYLIVRIKFSTQYVQLNIHFFVYIHKISAGILHIFVYLQKNNVYLKYLQNIEIAKKCICDCK